MRPLFCQFAEGKIHCTRQIIKPGSAAVLILQSGQSCEAMRRNGLCFNKEMRYCHIRVTTHGFPIQPGLQTKVQEPKMRHLHVVYVYFVSDDFPSFSLSASFSAIMVPW